MNFRRKLFAVIILLLSGGGLVAYAYSIALQTSPPPQNPCAAPSKATSVYGANFQGSEYTAENVTFTDVNQVQTVVGTGVTFSVISISDPSVPQYKNGSCISIQNSPNSATVKVRVTYGGPYGGGSNQDLTLVYGGLGGYETSVFTNGLTPKAGLLWQPGKSYLILLVSK